MNRLVCEGIEFQGYIHNRHGNRIAHESLTRFSGEFRFGNSYMLLAPPGHGAWALSWAIGGAIKPQKGEIRVDGTEYEANERSSAAWLVRFDEVRRFGFIEQSVKAQLRHGIRTVQKQQSANESALMKSFLLTPERYNRRLSQLSSEAWRASCAIGLVHGKRIFCFPPSSHLVQDYSELWLPKLLELMKAAGALIVFPYHALEGTDGLFDGIVEVAKGSD